MPRKLLLAATLFFIPIASVAQWQILNTPTTADLRGIHSLGNGIAWASGTNGTVLRTEDNGKTWQPCTTPPDAAKLDFRGIQAFDNKTAIVMSSGPGDLSRLYKTTDACQTWKLLFTNPDKEGFWDAVQAHITDTFDQPRCVSATPSITGVILGDPAVHKTNLHDSVNIPSFYLATFTINSSCEADTLTASTGSIFSGPGEASFAASNSVLYILGPGLIWFATDRQLTQYETGHTSPHQYEYASIGTMHSPLLRGTPSQGVFSFAVRAESIEKPTHDGDTLIAVGGDYKKPDDSTGTVAFTTDGGQHWLPATTPPHGYRSAVAYDTPTKTWITVGPNGTDISTDDGRNWHPLKPSPTDQPDADQHWNALSLPYVVGPHGRIGILHPDALQPQK